MELRVSFAQTVSRIRDCLGFTCALSRCATSCFLLEPLQESAQPCFYNLGSNLSVLGFALQTRNNSGLAQSQGGFASLLRGRGDGALFNRLPAREPPSVLRPRRRQRRGARGVLLLARRAAEEIIPPESTVTIIIHHPSVATRATVCRYPPCRPLVACVHIK